MSLFPTLPTTIALPARYKEAGFSTFRFEDFIDGRVRRLVPSVRKLVLKSTAPLLFGTSYAALPALLGFESAKQLEAAYTSYATTLRGPAKMAFAMPSLFDMDGGKGDAKALEAGLAAWARGGSSGGFLGASAAAGAGSGASLLWELASSVEQTTALASNMLCSAAVGKHGMHKECCADLVKEQTEALAGQPPNADITVETLSRMPQLEAFAREVMRVYPPSRPTRSKLTEAVVLPPAAASSSAIELPAGALVAPEPFVACAACDSPTRFTPSRQLAEAATAPPPLLPFGTAVPGAPDASAAAVYGEGSAAGTRLAVNLAKSLYVQASRMFEEVIIGAEPQPTPSGNPVHCVGDKIEVLLKPKMYYELQRGVKKLNF